MDINGCSVDEIEIILERYHPFDFIDNSLFVRAILEGDFEIVSMLVGKYKESIERYKSGIFY